MSRAVLIAISALLLGSCNALAQSGTPQEREACSRDASRFCRKQMADGDNAVQQCLQQNREHLGRACRKAFQDHGM
jgi:Na+-translocating ferredoxin:NAD+ oxidoreductase RnfG subunit